MAESFGTHYRVDTIGEFRKYKLMAERAIEQVDDATFFDMLDPEATSIAILVKHIAGNMRSRWRDFLTSDGEKPDRHRDSEFIIEEGDDRAVLKERWESGWQYLFDALEPLTEDDLMRTVQIRGQDHSVVQAINRQLTHYAYHVGQIVLLAKHAQGNRWQTLSIAPGQSQQFNAQMERRQR